MKYLLILPRKGILNMIYFVGNTEDFLGMYKKYQVICFCRSTIENNTFL